MARNSRRVIKKKGGNQGQVGIQIKIERETSSCWNGRKNLDGIDLWAAERPNFPFPGG